MFNIVIAKQLCAHWHLSLTRWAKPDVHQMSKMNYRILGISGVNATQTSLKEKLKYNFTDQECFFVLTI